jgi:TP901 family phage tail tape measure protein
MILDTFISIFKADAKELEQAHKDIEKSTDEIVDGMKDAEKQSKKSTDAIGSHLKKLVGAFAAFAAVKGAISDAVDRAADVERMDTLSKTIKTNIGDIDAFRKSIEQAGGSGEAALSALNSTFNAIQAAATNANSAQSQAFRRLGIDVRNADGSYKDTLETLLEVSDAMQGMSEMQGLQMVEALGISDPKIIQTMQKGRAELEAMLRVEKEHGVITKESQERAIKFNAAMRALSATWEKGKNALSDALLPALTWVMEKFSDLVSWMSEHKQFIIGMFTGIAAVITAIYLPAMISAAIATLTALAPFILIGAVIAAVGVAIGLLVDDIYNFIQGNDSLIGQIFEKFPKVKAFFDTIAGSIGLFIDGVKDAIAWVMELINKLDIVNGAKDLFNKTKSFFGFGDDVDNAQKQLDEAASLPINQTTSNTIRNSANTRNEQNVGIGEITINTQATDASGIAGDISGSLKEQLEALNAETMSGVAR